MFAIIYGLINGIGHTIGKTREGVDNFIKKNDAISKGKRTYYDHFGSLRFTDTDEGAYIRENGQGDRVMTNSKGKIYVNLTEEKFRRELNDKIKRLEDGKTLVTYKRMVFKDRFGVSFAKMLDYDIHRRIPLVEIEGNILGIIPKDMIKKWNLSLKHIIAYVDLEGNFVRFDDRTEANYPEEMKKEMKDYLNNLQKRYKNKYGVPSFRQHEL